MWVYLRIVTGVFEKIKGIVCASEDMNDLIHKSLFPYVIDQLGSEGWEMVNFVISGPNEKTYIFKQKNV